MQFNGQYRQARGLLWAAVLASLPFALFSPLKAQLTEVASAQLVDCGSTSSLDSRLLMQQWAAPGACAQPVRTRVTDRFLGFTCVENGTDAAVCRSYFPGPDSRAYDTAKFFRCVELGLTGSAEGVAIGRIREWAAPKNHCVWDPGAEILAMEVDFENSLVCAATLCMPVERLTVIGKLRLKQLLESAFRDLDLMSMSDGPRPVQPVRTGAVVFATGLPPRVVGICDSGVVYSHFTELQLQYDPNNYLSKPATAGTLIAKVCGMLSIVHPHK